MVTVVYGPHDAGHMGAMSVQVVPEGFRIYAGDAQINAYIQVGMKRVYARIDDEGLAQIAPGPGGPLTAMP